MGRSYTPKYRVEYRDNTMFSHGVPSLYPQSMAWDTKRDGKPTNANLEKWRKAYNESFNTGGVNFHASQGTGVIIHIYKAWIIEQKTGAWVTQTDAPMFEVA